GRRRITEKNCPLEPRNLAECFAGCLERLDLDIRARLIVLKLFERVVMDEAAGLADDANRILADAGVLPDMKAAPLAKASRGGGRGGSGPGRDNTATESPSQPDALQSGTSAIATTATAAPAAPAASDP